MGGKAERKIEVWEGHIMFRIFWVCLEQHAWL